MQLDQVDIVTDSSQIEQQRELEALQHKLDEKKRLLHQLELKVNELNEKKKREIHDNQKIALPMHFEKSVKERNAVPDSQESTLPSMDCKDSED